MKRVDLKVSWSSYNWANIYQNVTTFGKCFELGIKKEFLTNDFLKIYIDEINKNFSYTHYNIWIKSDFIVSELSFMLDDFFERLKKKLVNHLYGQTFPWYVQSLEKVYPFVKENILGIYKQTVFLKNYWGYHTPNFIHGRSNNKDIAKTLKNDFPKYIDDIQWENQEYRIFSNAGIQFNDVIAPIFPWELSFDKNNKWSIPIKYIDDDLWNKLDTLIDSTYEYFIRNDMVEFINLIEDATNKEEKGWLKELFWQESESKDLFMKYFLLYKDKLIDFVLDSYFKKSSMYGLDYYLYENQYFLDLTDLVFVGEYIEKTKGSFVLKNKFSLEMLQQMLIDGLKDWYFDHFVMKLTYFFESENGDSYKITELWEWVYEFFDGKETTNIELDKEEQKLLRSLGSSWKRKIRWGVTLWLYSQKLSKIKDFKLRIAKHMKISWYKIFFRKWGWENIFEHNNYLFQTNQIRTVTNLTPAINLKRFFEIMPEINSNSEDWIYLWINWYNKQPIIKQPFAASEWDKSASKKSKTSKEENSAKHMAVIWTSGAGKTFFMQQQIVTNIKDKCFVIDPTWTFSQLWLITDSITVKKIFDLEYNPITLDKSIYKKFWVDWSEGKKSKIDTILLLLKPKSLWASNDFMNILTIFLSWIYETKEVVTINLIYDEMRKIVDTKQFPEELELWTNWDNKVDQRSISIFEWLMRTIIKMKAEGQMFNLLNQEKDFLYLFLDNTKLVLNIKDLGIIKSDTLDERWEIILMYILQNILTYAHFNAWFIKENKEQVKEPPRNFIVFDEIHIMFNNATFRDLYALVLRTLRNLWSQITWLTQFVKDFDFSKYGWVGSLDILNMNFIKIFFFPEDIASYIELKSKAYWIDSKEWEEWEIQWDEPVDLKKLKYYFNEFQRIRAENETTKDFRLMLVEWYWDYYITIPQVSEYFIKKMSLLTSSN